MVSTLALAFALVMGISKDVSAQSLRYPWDKRPEHCVSEPLPKSRECEIDSWSTFSNTGNRVASLYQTEQFALLDRAMAETMALDRHFADGTTPADAVYLVFKKMMPAPGTQPAHREKINRWQEAIPNSVFAVFAQARFAYGSAWNVRGDQYGNSVSKESWELFYIRLAETERALLDAPQTLKDTPIWHRLLLAVTLDMAKPATSPQKIFDEAVKRWPRQFGFYELILTRMVPKWGGSWKGVDNAISAWSDQMAATEGKSLYARLYVSLLGQAPANETAMDWKKMKVSFDDLITRYPSPGYKNNYASLACFARDKPAFTSVLAKIAANELDRDEWLPGHSYEACMRWAGI